MSRKSCVVFGGTGYLGAHIVDACLKSGYSVRAASRNAEEAAWLRELPSAREARPGDLELRAFDLSSASDADFDSVLAGADCAFLAAGIEKQELLTVTTMVGWATKLLRSARREGVGAVVITSSGGSANPTGHSDSTPKREHEHYSNPGWQIACGKYSPAAKTLMEMAAFAEVGRSLANEVVDEQRAEGAPRLCIMNPNWINGPQLKPGPPSGNSLPLCARFLSGDFPFMKESIAPGSMSFVDVRDAASMHVACASSESASGRYFAVERSYAWEEIFQAFKAASPNIKVPPKGYDGPPNETTQYDNSRRLSIFPGELRNITETMEDVAEQLRGLGQL